MLAAYTAGALISGPLRGRRLDRAGYSAGLLPLGILSAGSSAAIVLAGELGAPGLSLGILAAIAGATTPPLGPALRSLWSTLLGGSAQLPAAYATTTMLNEIGFFGGPLLAGLLVAVASPAAALAAVSGTVLAGTLLFAAAPASRAVPAAPGRRGGNPLRAAGVRTVLLTGSAFGAVFGVLDVALPAFAVERGSPGAGGLLLAALSPGIVAGGYVYGRRALGNEPGDAYFPLAALAALGLVPLLFADSLAVLLAVVILAGATFAPVTTCQWALIDVVAPADTAVETTSWLTTVYLAGSVAGSAAGGVVIQGASATTAFWLAIGSTALAATAAALMRSTLVGPRAAEG